MDHLASLLHPSLLDSACLFWPLATAVPALHVRALCFLPVHLRLHTAMQAAAPPLCFRRSLPIRHAACRRSIDVLAHVATAPCGSFPSVAAFSNGHFLIGSRYCSDPELLATVRRPPCPSLHQSWSCLKRPLSPTLAIIFYSGTVQVFWCCDTRCTFSLQRHFRASPLYKNASPLPLLALPPST